MDVFSRRALEQRLEYSSKATNVVEFLGQLRFCWGHFGAIRLRTDNGAQVIATIVKDYCTKHGIEHEFIHPYTPSGCKYRTPRTVWNEFWRENPLSLFDDSLKTVA